MSPFKEAGYSEVDVFRVIDNGGSFPIGSIVVLDWDDGSSTPYFRGCGGCLTKDGDYRSCITLGRLERIWADKKTVTVICNGKTVEISKESAENLGLV